MQSQYNRPQNYPASKGELVPHVTNQNIYS